MAIYQKDLNHLNSIWMKTDIKKMDRLSYFLYVIDKMKSFYTFFIFFVKFYVPYESFFVNGFKNHFWVVGENRHRGIFALNF